ncbi:MULTISPECIES: DUF2057 family protein [Acinetobacter]|jgi:hypothetical protein|uniref:DUF2057 domain-containing protein n=2 Tax=Acinetobacter radioresistens TaxID=40216 RepID=A0A2T1IWM3_ACIRA|nr:MULTISPECIES: DUF2057 family protein [Acinetobacter]EET82581.1 hypothetical protein ACIRA0001_1799 [Acinetobacter radioresistens SK82]ENV88247.1 hypothetical protein F939_01872 [Acinetobacter radioresistens DSM 6976 = NBRC 102413 = CIP 103788]EXB30103.1 hypothetical protein J546_3052 [Acinetobacter sp. 1461402]EXB67921.1 hypothetical protein J550_3078 [Acinetobacter sp. 230853]EXE13364.1 hypothetical protein J559_2399 [Acinetobacter sp. 983759]
MLSRLFIAALIFSLGNVAYAAVTIAAPEVIDVLAVNDQEVKNNFLRSQESTYEIDAGKASLSIRYRQFFQHLNGEHDILKSGVVTVQTPDLKDGETYTLALVNPPQSFEAAKIYAAQPTVALYNSKNELVVQQTGANTEAKPWLGSGLLGRSFDLTQKQIKPSVHQPEPTYTASIVDTVKTAMTSRNTQTDQQLIELWKKASKAERQSFMNWIAEQAQ